MRSRGFLAGILLAAGGACAHAAPNAVAPSCPPAPLAAAPPVDEPLYDTAAIEVHPKRIGGPFPQYPGILKQEGIEGQATIEVIVDPRGYPEPGSVKVLAATHLWFGQEAAKAVAGSCWSPGMRHGRPVRVRLQIPIRFWIERL